MLHIHVRVTTAYPIECPVQPGRFIDYMDWEFRPLRSQSPSEDIPSDWASLGCQVAKLCGMTVQRVFITGHNNDGDVDEIYVPRADSTLENFPGCPELPE